MKSMTLLKNALAFTAASLVGASLHAQQTINEPSANGQLYIAFNATSGQGSTFDYEADLGSFANFLPNTGIYATGAPVSLSSFVSTADLASTAAGGGFGANWDSDSLVSWYIFGSLTTAVSPYVKYTILGGINDGSTPEGLSSGAQTGPAETIADATDALSGLTSTANSNYAAFIATSTGDSFDSDSTNSAAYFAYFPFQSNFDTVADGTTTTELELIQPNQAAVELGTFTLSSSGLTYTAVPEPSTWATMILGAASLLAFRRRRS